jgi:hypothetical protein
MKLFLRDRYSRFVVFMVLLVVGLRAWADYDQAMLYMCCSAAVQTLFHHAPADAFRFVVNFPMSLISWLLLPAPPYLPRKAPLNFVLWESLSVLTEVALTVVFWLGVGRLARSGHLTGLRKVPLRAALPLIFLIVAIALEKVGELQYEGIMRLGAPQEHPVDATWARDSFVGYAINAPAWAAWWQLPLFLNQQGERVWVTYLRITSWLGPNSRLLEYGFLVVVLWYGIGSLLDKRKRLKVSLTPDTLSWQKRLLYIFCLLYGGFLCSMARDSYYDSNGYAWFALSISIWSALLTLGSIHALCQDEARFWGVAARVFCVVYTILAACVSVLFATTPHYKFLFYGRWVAFAIVGLSLVALTQSLFWLIRPEKQKHTPARETP